MLTAVVAHAGQPPAPHDLWGAWNGDVALLAALTFAAWAYARGRTRGRRRRADVWRARCFAGAMVALVVALLSPLDALSGALASAHMVQHVLLVLVAAPLLALSAPSSTLLRGSPRIVRRVVVRAFSGPGRPLRRGAGALAVLRHPVAVWLCHVVTLWFWHAALPYDAALERPLLHAVEHGMFLGTGLLFWRVTIGARPALRVSPGAGVMLVFAMALQSVLLSLLLTFARTSWYAGYAATTQPWGLEPLADQQLAGVIMWVPAGLVYVAAGLALFVVWVRESERAAPPTAAGPDSGDTVAPIVRIG